MSEEGSDTDILVLTMMMNRVCYLKQVYN